MTIDPATLLGWRFPTTEVTYGDTETILYALGVGLGADPTDEADLKYLYEDDLAVLPTMAAVLGHPGPWFQDPGTGIDWVNVVHGEQALRLHSPLRPADTLRCVTNVTDVEDKGEGRGALVSWRRTLTRVATDEPVATVDSVLFCRADGGFGGRRRSRSAAAAWPDLPPAASRIARISPRAALIYRLSGDRNPLHVDPKTAAEAGFAQPILHGLCTYAMAVMAVVRECAGGDASLIARADARFKSPVFPGESLRTDIWDAGQGTVRFRATAVERDVLVLDAGLVELRGSRYA